MKIVFYIAYIGKIFLIFLTKLGRFTRFLLKILSHGFGGPFYTKIFINHSRRFDEKHLEVSRLIQKKIYGEFLSARIDYYGGFIHYGIHIIDFLMMCFKSEFKITKKSITCESKYINDYTLDIEGLIGNNPVNLIGHNEKYYQISEIDLFFEQGRILIKDFGFELIFYDKIINSENENILQYNSKLSGKGMHNTMINAYADLKRYFENKDVHYLNRVTFEKLEDIMKVMFMISSHN